MKAYYNITQQTEEWHKIKHGKIGGTLSAGLLVKSDTLLIDICSQLFEPFELEDEGYTSADMQRGNELEPIARRELSAYTGVEFLECGWIENDKIPLIGISPDGISKCETVQCEIKCPGKKNHFKYLLNKEIPKDYIAQIVHAFTVNDKLEKLYFCSFRPEATTKLFVKDVTKQTIFTINKESLTVESWAIRNQNEAIKLQNQINETLTKIKF